MITGNVTELRPSKAAAIALATAYAPQYTSVFRQLRLGGDRLRFPDQLKQLLNWTGPSVGIMYESDTKLAHVMSYGLLGKAGLEELGRNVSELSDDEKARWLDEFTRTESLDELLDFESLLQPTEQQRREQLSRWESMSESDRIECKSRSTAILGGLFAGFFNMLAVMVHGTSLTRLVGDAVAGDLDALRKAVQIDRRLVTHHPHFRVVKERAQDDGERELLRKIAYAEMAPPLRGKIRYPGLYILFAILDGVRWLDGLTHHELLDICDEAGLDRFQSRIEDVNYVTKRLKDYRRWQKSGCVSMH